LSAGKQRSLCQTATKFSPIAPNTCRYGHVERATVGSTWAMFYEVESVLWSQNFFS
jgi:hypothetical protein